MLYTLTMDQAKKQKTFRQNNFYTMQDTGIGFLVALLAPYAISLLVLLVCQTIIAGGVDGTALSESIGYKIVTALISPVAFCIAFFAFNKVKKISIKAAKVDFKIGTKNMIMCFVIAVVCFFGCMYFIGGIDHLLQLGGYDLSGISMPVDNAGWLDLSLIILAVLPAIFEELIFRGMLLNGLREGMGDVSALFMSAFLFAIMHGSLQQLIYPFILGVVLGWIAMRTGSTFCSMLVHFLNNAIAVIINYFTVRNELNMSIEYNAWQWVLAVGLVFVEAQKSRKAIDSAGARRRRRQAKPNKYRLCQREKIVVIRSTFAVDRNRHRNHTFHCKHSGSIYAVSKRITCMQT